MREVTASGQTVEEAIQSALQQLNTTEDKVEITIIDKGKKGFFGLFLSARAVVKVRLKRVETDSVETKETVVKELAVQANEKVKEVEDVVISLDEKIAAAKQYLTEVAKNMGVDVEIAVTPGERQVKFDLSGEKIAILIGKRGKVLNSLQYLTQLVLNKGGGSYHAAIVDAEGYRERRRETLEILAKKMAAKARRTDRKVALEPMPAYERKIIHSALQDDRDIITFSEGNEPHRYIVLKRK